MGTTTVRGEVQGRVFGRVTGGTGAFVGRGATVVRSGAGVYVFTFTGENTKLDPAQTMVLASIQQTGARSLVPSIDHTTDDAMTISTFDQAGAPADRDFKLYSIEFPPDAE